MMRGFGGLFGSPIAGMVAQQMGPRAPDAMQQPEQRWMDGGKFKGRDALGLALGAIGDAFTGRSNTANMILGNQQQRRDMATQQQLMAQQRAAGLEDYRSRKLVDQEFAQPDAPKPGSFEWYQTASPEQRTAYDAYNPVITTTYQGPTIVPRSSLGGGLPTAPVGRLTPIQPTIENTPAPQLNANGMPATLTRDQYAAVEQRMGQAETEAWARRNNIKVVN